MTVARAGWPDLLVRRAGNRHRFGRNNPARREVAGETAALARRAVDVERCAMPLQDVFHDRQAQPDTAAVATAARVDTKKSFGDSWQVLRVNTDAGVGYAETTTVRIAGPGQCYDPVRGRIADRIGKQVVDNRFDFRTAAAQLRT